MRGERVVVIGASADRSKYGNKAVRAYLRQGAEVFPVNPHEDTIEGLPVYRSVLEVPGALDRITVYVPPDVGLMLLDEIRRKGARAVFFNPGSESPALVARAEALGLPIAVACSIVDIGLSPAQFGDR